MLSETVHASDYKLPLLKTIGEIWTLLRKDWRALVQVVLIPALLLSLAGAVMQYEVKKYQDAKEGSKVMATATAAKPAPTVGLLPATDKTSLSGADTAILIVSWLVMGIAYVIAQIKGFRYLLLGEARSAQFFGRREWLYMGYNLLYVLSISAGMLVALIIGIILAVILKAAGLTTLAFVIAGLVGFALVFFIAMRLLLTFPVVALDHDTPMTAARALSKGHTLSMFGIIFLANLPVLLMNIVIALLVTFALRQTMAGVAINFATSVLFHFIGLLFYMATMAVIAYRLGLSNHDAIAPGGYEQATANSKDTLV